jgi:hypothetical protein
MKSQHEIKFGKTLFDFITFALFDCTAFRSESLERGMLSGMVGLIYPFYVGRDVMVKEHNND